LGATGFCRIWTPRYAALARPLYKLLKDAQWGSQSLLEWDPENIKAFQALKWSLQTALALSLPTQDCFQLYVYKKGWGRPRGTNLALRAHSATIGIFEQRTRQCH
jgi:hypothetical protein